MSGISTAWHLHDHGFEVKVFEKNSQIGGEARTVDVVVGEETRWVDLGVNDFNLSSYVSLVKILDDLGVEYRPLDDTACFYTMDGSIAYTADGLWYTEAPEAVERDAARFQREAPEVLTNKAYRHTLVKDYVAEKGYSDEFIQYHLYPRLNGMFFANWRGVGDMPIWPVMKYYSLQEGLDQHEGPRPKRMYFVNGSGQWMAKLYDAAKAKFPIVLNAEASVRAGTEGAIVHARGESERFDKVVLALQAHDALRCVKSGLTPKVTQFFSSFKYRTDEVVAHTHYGVLSPYVKAWRTYNILIRRNPAGSHPYTITYLVNRHQNDGNSSQNGASGTPHFFVTVNPPVPIPDSHVLRQPDGTHARAVFHHVAYDLDALKAQERRDGLQGMNNVYITGGYTRGAGLHEECWTDGMELAAHIKRVHQYSALYDDSDQGEYVPWRDLRETIVADYLR